MDLTRSLQIERLGFHFSTLAGGAAGPYIVVIQSDYYSETKSPVCGTLRYAVDLERNKA